MNIELMEEIQANKSVKKRSGRSIAWLMEELDMAIEAELHGFLAKYTKIKEANGNYGPLYQTAVRLVPAYDLLTIRNPDLAKALKTILDIKG